jgi:hypothetical protein
METFFIVTVLLIVVPVVSANLVLFENFYYYKKTYEALVSGEYKYDKELSGYGVYYFTKTPRDFRGILYFANDSDIKLINGGCLHNSVVTYFSPYSLYWYIKLNRWFKNNIENL